MKKTQHIPGPWKFDPATSKIWTQDGETDLALVLRLSDEGDASGRLMAAAPKMLEALLRLLSLSGSIDQSATHDGLKNCDMLAKVRAAIAQAEGEQ